MLNIRIHGTDRLKTTLRNLNKEVGDQRAFFRQVAIPEIERQVKRTFDTEGFGKWPRLKEETIRRKGHDRILVDTGRLRNAATNKDHRDNFTIVRRNTLTYGVRVPYAQYHEFGTRRLPRRPVFEPAFEGVIGDRFFRDKITRRYESRLDQIANT